MTLPKPKPIAPEIVPEPAAPTPEPKPETPEQPQNSPNNESLQAELDNLTAQVKAAELNRQIAEQKAKLESFNLNETEPEDTEQGVDIYEAINDTKPDLIVALEKEAAIMKGGS